MSSWRKPWRGRSGDAQTRAERTTTEDSVTASVGRFAALVSCRSRCARSVRKSMSAASRACMPRLGIYHNRPVNLHLPGVAHPVSAFHPEPVSGAVDIYQVSGHQFRKARIRGRLAEPPAVLGVSDHYEPEGCIGLHVVVVVPTSGM